MDEDTGANDRFTELYCEIKKKKRRRRRRRKRRRRRRRGGGGGEKGGGGGGGNKDSYKREMCKWKGSDGGANHSIY